MPTHVRAQIRLALAAALAGLPTTGAAVYVNRKARIDPSMCPCLLVSIAQERVDEQGPEPMQRRALSVEINGYVAQGTATDDALDAIGLEVESAVAAAGQLGGLIKAPMALGLITIGTDDTHGEQLGRIEMQFATITYTYPADAATVI